MKHPKIWALTLIGFGLLGVIGTHIYMLLMGLPPEQMVGHAIINLISALLISLGVVYEYFC